MFTNLSSYDDLLENNGKFGLFQVLKSIYNVQKDFFASNIIPKDNNELNGYESNIFEQNEENEFSQEQRDTLDIALDEISLEDWDMTNTRQV